MNVAEPFLRRALTINENFPQAHALLAQNLASQGRREEALKIAYHMLKDFTFPTVFTDNDHAEKVVEALIVVRNLEGKTSPNFLQLAQETKQKYSNLAKKIDSLQNESGCNQN